MPITAHDHSMAAAQALSMATKQDECCEAHQSCLHVVKQRNVWCGLVTGNRSERAKLVFLLFFIVDVGRACLMHSTPSASPSSSLPLSGSNSTGTTPKKGSDADPGFSDHDPGRGVIM